MKHCWTDRSEWIEATYGYLSEKYIDDAAKAYDDPNWCSSICMLPAGHSGPHQWTRADQIVVTFAEKYDQMPEVTVPSRPESRRTNVGRGTTRTRWQHVAARGVAAILER